MSTTSVEPPAPWFRGLRRFAKRVVASFFGAVLGSGWIAGRRSLVHPPSSILVLRVDERVGNVLLTTPLLAALREAYPSARIDCLVAASKAPILRGLARVIPFEKRHFFVRPLSFLELLLSLRRTAYDVVIDASHWHHFSATSAMLLAWTQGARRIAHERGSARLYATDLVAPAPMNEPEIESKLRLLGPLGIDPRRRSLETALGTSLESTAPIASWLEAQSLSGVRLVGLAPGGRKADHRVDPSVFAALGRAAEDAGARPVVLWGPGEEALASQVAQGAGALVAPATDLEQLAALMRRCAAVVTNDTGPMHLSVACRAPTIALFRSADPVRWGHADPPNVVIPADGRGSDQLIATARTALLAILGGRATIDSSSSPELR